ncbi:hypothetical protein [Streptomyces sp. HUAS TT7]|uniref:WXG100 family type VII secretion target n=1 Tax=Streptomyces sp. HUAS TT7 TaxID=3447507 RepID=UPI003F65BAD2
MTDKKPQPQPAQLTDKQRVGQQVDVTDMTFTVSEALSAMSPFGGTIRLFGKTDFEGHQLNQMIDLVQNANPEHLTSAGDALFAAHKAINDAASELDGHIGNVEWEGESGEAFRTWGKKLVGHAQELAKFADTAAVQISAAGEGLAFVRHAMPPRDHRAEPVKVADIPPTKRIAGNAEYEAAVTVEKDRQEAINQMNRLSSFYSVSEQTLAAQQPPVFEPMPNVGVPQPENRLPKGEDPSERSMPGGASHRSPEGVSAVRHTADTPAGHARTEITGTLAGTTGHSTSAVSLPPSNPVGTEINSVMPSPAPVQSQAVVAPTPPVTQAAPGVTTAFPPSGGFFNPTGSGSARAFGGGRGLGMAEPAGGPASATGRGTTNPAGRVGTSASEAARGGSSSAVGQSPMGRGVSGGTPRVGGAASPRAGTAGASGNGRNGIVGGRPSAQSTGSAGSRTSNPTVVGAKGAPGHASSTNRLSQRGVVGAAEPSETGKARTGGRVKGNADGVVGVPQGRSTGKRGNDSGFTSGGSGLARGSRDEQEALEGEEDETTLLPSHSGEDGEKGLPSR